MENILNEIKQSEDKAEFKDAYFERILDSLILATPELSIETAQKIEKILRGL